MGVVPNEHSSIVVLLYCVDQFISVPNEWCVIQNSKVSVSDVGILGFELYFPKNYVCQKDLEQFDGVGAGKYTIGLGQSEMSFCYNNEDVCSLALSATSALLHNYKIDADSIGFLEVGSETLIDKSKRADVKNACFGGTQAMLHAVDWVYSNYDTEERLAIVVCVDIAVYAAGPARCTGGAGAVALLIGPNASLVLERGLRGAFSKNTYDFYKP
uniref:Hydroxymethylglutaryl-coenzyme A synthase N-terminal domain-containing protein n=1 Tax=Ditylenchus dipsaci TaxID=166011 RepID=A0A915D4I5_9BILA